VFSFGLLTFVFEFQLFSVVSVFFGCFQLSLVLRLVIAIILRRGIVLRLILSSLVIFYGLPHFFCWLAFLLPRYIDKSEYTQKQKRSQKPKPLKKGDMAKALPVPEQVPLSFKRTAVFGTGCFIQSNSTDIQELNSLAATQHYSDDSTFYLLNSRHWTDPSELIGADYVVSHDSELVRTHKFDAEGATILHQCFQDGRYDTVKWWVTKYPIFSLEPFKSVDDSVRLPYGGQNILHMAVRAKNYSMAKWLLEHYSRTADWMLKKLLTARVYTQSGYFDKKQSNYFGETPLHFAVCMDDTDMVDLVLSFASVLDAVNVKKSITCRNMLYIPDCNGNNVVHLCVKRSLPSMYQHLQYFAVEMIQQELMTAFHESIFKRTFSQPFAPVTVSYSDWFEDDVDYSFKGYIYQLGTVKMPLKNREVQDSFLVAQICNEIRRIMHTMNIPTGDETRTVATVDEFYRRLPEDFVEGHKKTLKDPGNGKFDYSDVVDYLMNPRRFEKLIAKLRQELSLWLYGADAGVKSGAINQMFTRLFMHSLNEDGHAPKTLVAVATFLGDEDETVSSSTGQAQMLRHFLTENICEVDRGYQFDLTAIEFALNRSAVDGTEAYVPALPSQLKLRSSISWICRSGKATTMVESIPEVEAVLDYKWVRLGTVWINRNIVFRTAFFVCLLLLCASIKYGGLLDSDVDTSIELYYSAPLSWILLSCCFVIFFLKVLPHWYTYFQRYENLVGRDLPVVLSLCEVFYASSAPWSTRATNCIRKLADVPRRLLGAVGDLIKATCTLSWRYKQWSVPTKIGPVLGMFHINLQLIITTLMCLAPVVTTINCFTVRGIPCVLMRLTTICCLMEIFVHLMLVNKHFGCFLLTMSQIFYRDFIYFGYFFLWTVVLFSLLLTTFTAANPWDSMTPLFEAAADPSESALIFCEQDQGPSTTEHDEQFLGLVYMIIKFIQAAVQDEDNDGHVITRILTTSFHVTIGVIMMNLLIAVMTETHRDYNSDKSKALCKCIAPISVC
jgi:ankyrin repeat protein